MPIYATEKTSNFEKPPTGMQKAVCAYVHDIGMQKGEYKGEVNIKHQIIITWELEERLQTGEFAGKRFLINKWYTLSLSEKASLRKDLEAWRGRNFTKEEAAKFDVEKLVGANCYLNIIATESGNRKVASVTPLPNGVPKITVEQPTPSDKFMEFINQQRGKGVTMESANQTSDDWSFPSDAEAPPVHVNKDELPF